MSTEACSADGAGTLTFTKFAGTTEAQGQSMPFPWEACVRWFRKPIVSATKSTLDGFAFAEFANDYRSRENVRSVHALVLDDDSGVHDVDALVELWKDFAGLVHTTHSSTSEAPRTRTVLRPSRPMTAEEYPHVWAFFAGAAAANGVQLDQQTKDPSRFWFRPAVRPDGVYVIAELPGEPFDVDAVLALAPSVVQPVPSVAAPSIAPAPARAQRLELAAQLLGAAWPGAGNRHVAQLALAGALQREGFDQETAVETLCKVCSLAGNEDRAKRTTTVSGTYQRAAQGKPTFGWTKLAEVVDPAVVAAARGMVQADAADRADLALTITESNAAPAAAAEKPKGPRFELVHASELAKPVPPVGYVFRHFGIAPGRPSLLAGYGGIGKTFLVMFAALRIASGAGDCWGLPVASGGVVHIDYEMTLAPTQRRYQRIAHALGIDLGACDLSLVSMPRIYLSDSEALPALVDACNGRVLCIVDNLAAATASAREKENEAGVRQYLDTLTRVSAVTGCCFLVLVHERKASKDDAGGLQRVRGSSAITDASGSVLSVSAAEGDGVVTVSHVKTSLRRKGEDLTLSIEDVGEATDPEQDDPPGLIVRRLATAPVNERSRKVQARILELLALGAQESKRKIEQALKLRSGDGGVEVDALLTRREIVKIPGKGFCIDTPIARLQRVYDAVSTGAFWTPAQIAKAAHVDTDVVGDAMRQGVVCRSADGRFLALGAP